MATIRAKEDLTGKQFGNWIVIREATKEEKTDSNNSVYWLCKCNCGTEKYVKGTNLKLGKSTSCGKCNHNFKDLSGEKFDKLTVLRRASVEDILNNTNTKTLKGVFWWVQCDCGSAPKVVRGNDLKQHKITSCGCNQKEHAKEQMKKIQQLPHSSTIKDLTGQQFGFLVPLYPTEQRKRNFVVWHCKCLNCGNECDISSNLLTGNHTHSCGCLQTSLGELKIKEILENNLIPFEKEKKFETCRSPINSKYYLRFDFYVKNNYLIEYDGRQHFKAEGHGWDTEKHLQKTQLYDKIKNQWCKDNNIPLIRIPYTHYKDLRLEDLLLETSQFIVS